MNRYIALNRQALSGIRYHWFFGLSFCELGMGEMHQEVERLKVDGPRLKAIVSQMNMMWSTMWLICAFFWLFNINQYRKNYCILQCYIALVCYEEGIKHMETQQGVNASSEQVFILTMLGLGSVLAIRELGLVSAADAQLTWLREQIEARYRALSTLHFFDDATTADGQETDRLLGGSTQLPSYSSTAMVITSTLSHGLNKVSVDVSCTFKVTNFMLPWLETLGFASPMIVGTDLTFGQVRTYYLKRLLQVHPDKGGLVAEFHAVQKAYADLNKELRCLYFNDEALMSAVSSSQEEDVAEDNMSSIDRVAARLEALQRAMDHYAKCVDEFSQGVNAFGAKIAATRIQAKDQHKHYNGILNGIKGQLDEIEAARVRQAAMDLTDKAVYKGQNVHGFYHTSVHQANQADGAPSSSLNSGCNVS